MFGRMDFCSPGQPWSLGQRDVHSDTINSSSSPVWNERVFHFCCFDHHLCCTFSVYLATFSCKFGLGCLPHFLLPSFLSLYTSKSNFCRDTSTVTGPMFLPCSRSASNLSTPLSSFPSLKQFTLRSPVTSTRQMQWMVLHPYSCVQHQWPLIPHCTSLFLWLPTSVTLRLSPVFLVSISVCFASSCMVFQH